MTTKPFDPTKPVHTRDGRPARIICTDRKGIGPLVVLLEKSSGEEGVFYYREDGRHCWNAEPELINIPKRHVRWVNCYSSAADYGYGTREEADRRAARSRIACVRVEFEEGEGL